jgi:hypothetical protein
MTWLEINQLEFYLCIGGVAAFFTSARTSTTQLVFRELPDILLRTKMSQDCFTAPQNRIFRKWFHLPN